MRRHKIIAQIILLILSAINVALAAPVLVRGIREVRVVVDVAGNVTTAPRKRWNPSEKWWTNAADRTNTPPSLGSSDSDYRLEQELRPHDRRSPMDPNASPQPNLGSTDPGSSHPLPVGSRPPAHDNLPSDTDSNSSPLSSLGSTDSDNSHPLSEGSPAPVHDNLPFNIDLNDNPQPEPGQRSTDPDNAHPPPVGSPPPAHNKLPLDIDLNEPPQPEPGQGSTDPDNAHPLPVGSPPPAHNNLPLDIDLNDPLQPERSQGLTDSNDPLRLSVGPLQPAHSNVPDLNANPPPSQEPVDGAHSGSLTYSSSYYSTDSATQSDSQYSTDSAIQSSSYDSPSAESSSDVTISPSAWDEISVYEFPKSPGPTPSQESNSPPPPDANPPPPHGNLHIDLNRPPADNQPPPSDPGSSKRPYEFPPSDPGPSKRPYSPSDPGPSTWAGPLSDSGSSTWVNPSDLGSSVWGDPSDPGSPTWTDPLLDLAPSTRPYPPSDPRPSASDPGQSTGPYPPSDPRPSTSDPGLSTPHPPSSAGPMQHESGSLFSELFRGRFKRRISGSRSVNAARRKLQGALDSRDPTIKGRDKILNAPATSAIRRVITRRADTSSHSLPGHLQSRRKPVSRGLVSLREEDFRLLSALARRRLERLD